MSKLDAMRAMREARYEQQRSATPARRVSAPPAVAPPVPSSAEEEPALCGHRNMSGRTCTREQGHAAKSHRYS